MSLVVFGVNLPSNKKVNIALISLYGIGKTRATQICANLGFPPQIKIKDITEAQQFAVTKKIKDDFIVEGSLEEQIKQDLNHHQINNSLHGYRLRNGLPVRGQRTHSNAKTSRKRLAVRKILLNIKSNNHKKMDGRVV
jgi:small subunit ribosomal protein S13